MTENIEYNEILEVFDDKGVIHLDINIKNIVRVVEPGSPFQNKPHSKKRIFFETNVIDSK